jgi:hypothetical protein
MASSEDVGIFGGNSMKITNPLQTMILFAPFSLALWALAAWGVSAIFAIPFWTAVLWLVVIALIGVGTVSVWMTSRGIA